jgi:hypothetical protein
MMMMLMVIYVNECIGDNQGHTQGGCWVLALPLPNFKGAHFVGIMISKA